MNNDAGQLFQYDAFISYRHTEPDITIAKKLMDMLEGYKAPRNIAGKSGIKSVKRVFRDREELPTTTDLSESILTALKSSRFLIIVCSPRTPESKWVKKEIEIFKELRGAEYIQALLIEGEPEESFPEPLNFETIKTFNSDGSFTEHTRELELLAADIRPEELKGSQRLAYGASSNSEKKILKKSLKMLKTERLRCLAPMFGCKFDELYQRHFRRTMRNVVAVSLLSIILLASFGAYVASMNGQLSEQTRIAIENENRAQENAREAEKQADIARQNEEKANENAAEAEKQANIAQQNEDKANASAAEAETQRQAAEQQTAVAVAQTQIATQQRDKALISQSRFLSDLSRQQMAAGDRVLATMLALEALPKDSNNPDGHTCRKPKARCGMLPIVLNGNTRPIQSSSMKWV